MRGFILDPRTFCFVCVPAPGHSTMMSSLASVFVANANATPEKVVPCFRSVQAVRAVDIHVTYKVNADYELRFATVATLNLC